VATAIRKKNCKGEEHKGLLQDLHIHVALLSETHFKPHERFFISNYNFYRSDHLPERKLPLQLEKAFPITIRPASP
jgi:hypothetical protein